MRRFITPMRAILCAAGLTVAGCNTSTPVTKPVAEDSTAVSKAVPKTAANHNAAGSITVTLTEGTNFAPARNPIDGSFVLSLQGTLFRIPAQGGAATALTDYYQDAREPQFSRTEIRLCTTATPTAVGMFSN